MSETWAINEETVTSRENRSQPSALAPSLTKGGRMLTWTIHAYASGAMTNKNGTAEAAFQTKTARALDQTGGFATAQGGTLISSTEDSPAKISAWPASGPVLGVSAAVSGLSSLASLESYGPAGASSRMLPGFSRQIQDVISASSLPRWTNSGSMSHGALWTRSTSESRNAAAACSLSAVLEDQVPPRYFLSPRAARGILRRAERRGKTLPLPLRQALEARATDMETPGTPPT